jgi:sulfate adenylyltransferase subunit 2
MLRRAPPSKAGIKPSVRALTHLDRLEAESIHILRETVAEADKPVMLYSIGKDSAVMLHLAKKAFFPSRLPFPLLHVDTTWKFRDMYALRDKVGAEPGIELIVYKNPEAVSRGINPFEHGPLHTDMWKTEGLKQALDKYGFDAAFGGARRDEEKSRAKERVFSFRDRNHRWDPKRQRPELWSLYNVRKNKGESMRVFPLSNWTELDVWTYIQSEGVEIPQLYLAKERPVIERGGMLYVVNEFTPVRDGETPRTMRVRYRTVGDANLTAAVEADADKVEKIVVEIAAATITERGATRGDDRTSETSMEDRKREGYF